MFKGDLILKKIENCLPELETKYRVKRIGLFGSYSRDEQTTKSDIDFLVEFEPGGKTFANYMGLLFFIEEMFNNKIDLVIADAIKPELKPIIFGSVRYASRIPGLSQ